MPRMNRPTLHNAFNEEVISEIHSAFSDISRKLPATKGVVSGASTAVPRVVVLSGNGASFSAGADLNWMASMAKYTEEENKADSLKLFDMFDSIRTCPLPVIARVNGAALGGGCGLVAACDIAVAIDSAKFAFSECAIGLIPAVISRFCIDKIGVANASRYFLTAARFSAAEALRIGLVSSVVASPQELDSSVQELAATIANNSPAAVRSAKALIRRVAQPDMDLNRPETRAFVAGEIAAIRVSKEGQAGLNAFLNKAKAPWVLPKEK